MAPEKVTVPFAPRPRARVRALPLRPPQMNVTVPFLNLRESDCPLFVPFLNLRVIPLPVATGACRRVGGVSTQGMRPQTTKCRSLTVRTSKCANSTSLS